MSLYCLSFSHHHVPIAFRERVHFDGDALANACARFRCGDNQPTRMFEMVVLSTCNRTELYVVANDQDSTAAAEVKSEILTFVSQARGIDERELQQYCKWYSGPSVIEHLSRVACGIESLVLGEPQILGQVGDAMRTGLIMNSCGVVLTRLFQACIRSGRRARTETAIGENSLNVSTVAVNTAKRELGDLAGKTVVLLGAGEMAELALQQLRRFDIGEVLIVNRTLEAAKTLAEQHEGKGFVFEQITELLGQADILISSTGAPHTLLSREMLELAMQRRSCQKMFVLDIAVPRDVDPEAASIANVEVCDIDDLNMVTGQAAELRKEQVPQVEAIIEQEVELFLKWYRGIGVESVIAGLRQKADQIRQSELTRLRSLLPNAKDSEWQVIERFSMSLMKKLLHDPTVQLRKRHGTREAIDHAEAIRELFQFEVSEKIKEHANIQ